MAKDNDNKVQNPNNQIEDMRDVIADLLGDQEIALEEIKYLNAFISYNKLEEEYRYFRENAHEKYDEDLPFPILTL